MNEKDYGYEYPIKALRYKEIEVNVREMRKDEMPDDSAHITYYCDENATIYEAGEKDFEIID